jgi:hypothetical protein
MDDLPWHQAPSISPARADAGDQQQMLIRAMVTLLTSMPSHSHAEALRMLRDGFPETPLALRVAAFARRLKIADGDGRDHIPR